jgi:hypothetical protein
MQILRHAVALEALYDSADSFPQPRCHPETRMTMLEDIYKWAVQDNSSLPIRWLHGPAGAGKSAIMQSLCQRLKNARRLGGAFFFKRHHRTRGNAKVLFATLAYQLALSSRHLKPLISQSVEDDPSVVARHMDVQLRRLIVEPCQSLTNNSPPILLVDGLDECQDEGAQREILQLIRSAFRRHPYPFRILIASRPEAHIRDILGEPSFSRILHSINVQQSFEDVRTYFRDEFARIRREHRDTMGSVPIPWPSREVLNSLVEKSSGYFVYASTVIKFIDDKYFRPTERLAAVQNLTATDSDAPFGALDQMYIQILSGVPVASRSKLSDVLHCVVLNLNLQTLHIERLLELQPGDIRLLLRGLHSVLEIHPTGDIFVHHASFLDFLQDRQRASVFYISIENRINVARAVLRALNADDPCTSNFPLLSSAVQFSDPWIARWLTGDLFVKCVGSIPPEERSALAGIYESVHRRQFLTDVKLVEIPSQERRVCDPIEDHASTVPT